MSPRAVDARAGARPEDWDHFAALGLTADLLPVVSDASIGISLNSTMQAAGKTPSIVGGDGLIVGLAQWTQRQSTAGNVARWRADGRLGICLQTRNVRAIDVDVPQGEQAAEIAAEIEAFILALLPRRSRPDSAKFLLAFRMGGGHRKRVIRTEHGIIEFLANGQQFVAVGRHPDGAHYRWDGAHGAGLPPEFPEITAADFSALWLHLNDRFGVAPETVGREAFGPSGAEDRDPTADDVVRYIEEHGWVLGIGREGERYVRCPWEHEHTTQSGVTASAWFPAGSGGYEQGHYRCLHAHCEHRGRGEFLAEIGYAIEDFETLTTIAIGQDGRPLAAPEGEAGGQVSTQGAEVPWPAFERVAKGARAGKILSTANNLMMALRRPDFTGWRIAHDEFRDEITIGPHDASTAGEMTAFRDDHYMRLRLSIENRGFEPISKELLRDAVALAARECTYDSARAWLHGLKWDGVPRIERFFTTYLGSKDTAYARALGLYLWTALAGRVSEPGVKADIVPILEGEQGIRKSTAVAAIAPTPDCFVEIGLADKEEDLARKMRGALVAEIAELDGLHTRAIEGIKKFITRTHEKWVPKYKEFATTFARRLVFVGTTNRDDLLADETGNRRWAPINVTRADVEAIVRDREQLWAEGFEVFGLAGVCWQGVEDLAAPAHEAYAMGDEWETAVCAWLETTDPFAEGAEADVPRGEKVFTTAQLLVGAIGMPMERVNRLAQNRVAMILRRLGYEKKPVKLGRRPVKAWVRKGAERHEWLAGGAVGGGGGAGAGDF